MLDERPTTPGEQSTALGKQPSTLDQRPATLSERPTTLGQRPSEQPHWIVLLRSPRRKRHRRHRWRQSFLRLAQLTSRPPYFGDVFLLPFCSACVLWHLRYEGDWR